MKKLPYAIHEHLRTCKNGTGVDAVKESKSYPRMEQISLGYSPLRVGLDEVLKKRASSRSLDSSVPLSAGDIGTLLGHALGVREGRSRHYPSGGAVFPIETYLFTQNVESLTRGAFHYRVVGHALERLWNIPDPLNIFSNNSANTWANAAPLTLMFTAVWDRNCEKYGDFGYYLGMLEAGHMAQNILLVATALNLGTCPLARFDDKAVIDILDLDNSIEQPVYAIAIGST